MKRIPELLAPVGGPAQLYAAVNSGADAVYLGGARFNARAKAENFGGDRMRTAIEYAHERNVKVYVTFNTLLKDRELPDALAYGAELYEAGADAVIVQDMGLARLLGKYVPDLPLHLSTQGTVYNPEAVGLMKEFGFQRIVPARELTLAEIRAFTEAAHAPDAEGRSCEVEVFAHGALCMCYSGQCQMSRLLGGSEGKNGIRSGNRGLCAQPCRLPYTDDRGRTGYFLSPKDLCLLEEIPALAEAGVDSLKIEGRLKSPEYVAVTTAIYRKYLDRYASEGSIKVQPEDLEELKQIYCRGDFTTGYLYGDPGDKLLSGASPRHTGIYVGRVRGVASEGSGAGRKEIRGAARKGAALIDIDLSGTLAEGDGVEIRPKHSERTGVRGGEGTGDRAGGLVTYLRQIPGGLCIGDMKGRISSGDRVFKVTDKALLTKAGQSFAAGSREEGVDTAALDRAMKRKISLEMEFTARPGEPAALKISELTRGGGRVRVRVCSAAAAEHAVKRPADPERIRAQLGKLGGTPFEAADDKIQVDLAPDTAIPISEINRMRREGIDLLLEEKRRMGRTPVDQAALEEARERLGQQRLQIPSPEEVTGRLGKPVPLETYMKGEDGLPYLLPVTKGAADACLREHLEEVSDVCRARGILVNNAGWIRQLQGAGVKVYGGHGLNIYNEESRLAYADAGVEVVELSHEADLPLDGKIPLIITEHPVKSKTLTDRKGQVHLVEVSPSGDKTLIW